jgi:general stress protein YciG
MSSDNRGLISADEGTKRRVAKAGGEARAQDKEGLSEAGRRGGEIISQDREHLSEIGKKGGQK